MRALAILVGLSAALPAQDQLWEIQGTQELTQIGSRTVRLGDLDRDGIDDLLTMAWAFAGTTGRITDSQIWFVSGKDGSVLRVRPQWAPFRPYWTIAAAGDMDGDGFPDYLASITDTMTGQPLLIEARSGKDDQLFWSVQEPGPVLSILGYALLGELDVDGDGKPDVVMTAPDSATGGDVYVYRHDGTLLYRVAGSPALQFGFNSVACLGHIGDFDRDGADDFLVGALDGVAVRGAAAVISGRTGAVLVKGLGPNANEALGHAVDSCGDMDLDGVTDFIGSSVGAGSEWGVVVAFSGRSGAPLHTWWGPRPGRHYGEAIRSRGQDLDQDGIPDVVVGAPFADLPFPSLFRGSVFAYSGRDGQLLWRMNAPQPTTPYLGLYLEILPPLAGDTFPRIVIPEQQYGRYISQTWGCCMYTGRIRMLRSAPPGVTPYGTACAGTLARAPRIGMLDLGTTGTTTGIRLNLSDAPPASPALLLLGLSRTSFLGVPLPAALDPFGFPGCQLYTSVEVALPVTTGASGTAAGFASLDLPIPLALPGSGRVTLHGQWLAFNAGQAGGALSAPLLWQH